jgi:V/A-type H+/Na+-transporting ATPase subunit I
MILPMKKYAILVHHKDFHKFLKDLQRVGVVDVIDRGVEPDFDTNCEIQRVSQFDQAIKFLKARIQKDTPENTNLMPGKILKIVLQSQSEIEEIRQKIGILEKLRKANLPWGNFDPDLVKAIEENNYKIHFYACSQKKFDPAWQENYHLEIISQFEGQTFFVIVEPVSENIEIDAEEVKAPDRSVQSIDQEVRELKETIGSTEKFLAEHARAYIPKLEEARAETQSRISFDNVLQNSITEAEDKLKIVEGWVPVSKEKEVNDFLESHDIFYLVGEPEKDDKVPILLKNGYFSKLFEPIGKLYALPNYKEMDLTPFFAPFYMLFFGFCLGDAGYGLLFLIGATIFKTRMAPDMKPILSLIQWLGGSTVVFGILTGTFFGINLIELAEMGRITFLDEVKDYMLDADKMFYAALILGGIQIIFGLCLKVANIIKYQGFKYALSTIGWIILIVGGGSIYALTTETNAGIMQILLYIILGVSGVFILFLNNPDKGLLANFGVGIWDSYSMATGVLGDLLSYIRLFALGVSSAILGYVFNDLALQMSGSLPVVSQLIFLIIILIGHSLNLFVASLGAFVHPMRLTFVEFYKNAGFQGGGKAYSPFSIKPE